jgi:hypothetical protein
LPAGDQWLQYIWPVRRWIEHRWLDGAQLLSAPATLFVHGVACRDCRCKLPHVERAELTDAYGVVVIRVSGELFL